MDPYNQLDKAAEDALIARAARHDAAASHQLYHYYHALLAKEAFAELKKHGDFEEYGGAPLMGLNGVCIIGHGVSTPKAIKNAIRVAHRFVEQKMPEGVSSRIFECGVEKAAFSTYQHS